MANEQINVDLIPGKVPPTCHCSQYDVGRVVRVNLTEGGSAKSVASGESYEIHVRKTDGNIVTAACSATVANTYVEFTTTEQMTACAGMNLCEIQITLSTKVIGTLNFIMAVEEDPIAGGSPSESEIYNIQALVDNAVAANATITGMESEIEDAREGADGTIYNSVGEHIREVEDAVPMILHWNGAAFLEPIANIVDAFDDGQTFELRDVSTGEGVGEVYSLYYASLWTPSELLLYFQKTNAGGIKALKINIDPTTSTLTSAQTDSLLKRDNQTTTSNLWSAKKTSDEISLKASVADWHVSENDAWSSSKIVSFLPTDTASGAIASFDDGADAVPIVEGVFNIDYDANGYTGQTIYKAGKNLFDKSDFITRYSSYYELAFDGSIKTVGNLQANNVLWENVSNYSGVVTVTFKYKYINGTGSAGLRTKIEYTDGTTTVIYTTVVTDYNTVIATSNSTKTVRKITTDFGTTSNVTNFYLQVELGSTSSTYESFTGAFYAVDWTTEAGTVYGGSLNLTTGVLTSTKAADGSDLAEPVEYQLDPVVIPTLLGNNNIYCDTGDSAVTYRADVQRYIDKKIAAALNP